MFEGATPAERAWLEGGSPTAQIRNCFAHRLTLSFYALLLLIAQTALAGELVLGQPKLKPQKG